MVGRVHCVGRRSSLVTVIGRSAWYCHADRPRSRRGARVRESGSRRTRASCVWVESERDLRGVFAWALFPSRLVRHQDRQGLLMHEVERHPAELPFVKPRMSKRASDDKISVLGVEVGEQGLDRGQIAGVGPVGDVLGLDAVRGQVIDQHLG